MLKEFFMSKEVQDAIEILINQFPLAIWETVYVTVLSTFFAIIIAHIAFYLQSLCCRMKQRKLNKENDYEDFL